MTVSELIQPGDKVDIRLVQQVARQEKTDAAPKVYKSQVLDRLENGNLEISMPTEGGKLMLLPLEVRFEFVFYSGNALYRGDGQIVERYKRDNIYMLEIELKTPLERFQRREYYRFPCIIDINFYDLTEEEAALPSGEEIFKKLQEGDIFSRLHEGRIVDISGGGARIHAAEALNPQQYILIAMRLAGRKLNKQYYIVGSVIESLPIETSAPKKQYGIRVKFLIKNDKVKEEIIQFIFEEERRLRQTKKG